MRAARGGRGRARRAAAGGDRSDDGGPPADGQSRRQPLDRLQRRDLQPRRARRRAQERPVTDSFPGPTPRCCSTLYERFGEGLPPPPQRDVRASPSGIARERTLFAARDRLGIKPFCLPSRARRSSPSPPRSRPSWWATRVSATRLARHVADYLFSAARSAAKTGFAGVRQPRAGPLSDVARRASSVVERYWDISYSLRGPSPGGGLAGRAGLAGGRRRTDAEPQRCPDREPSERWPRLQRWSPATPSAM